MASLMHIKPNLIFAYCKDKQEHIKYALYLDMHMPFKKSNILKAFKPFYETINKEQQTMSLGNEYVPLINHFHGENISNI